MPFSGVIFDCDGTLVDTEPLANDVFATMLSAEGLPITGHEAMDDPLQGKEMGRLPRRS